MSELSLSLLLSEILDDEIGDDDLVKCRRNFNVHFFGMNADLKWLKWKTYMIGSRFDGMELEGSDFDIMHVFTSFYVGDAVAQDFNTNSHISAISTPVSSSVHMNIHSIPTDEYNINFVNNILGKAILHYNGCLLISSCLYINSIHHNLKVNSISSDIIGPSNTFVTDNGDMHDQVYAFQCRSWPKVAAEWKHRNRKYSWPSPKLVSLIESFECHFVPVGEHNSIYGDLEWRVSFVMPECILVRSFNHVQFKIYGLLKILKSRILHEYKHPVTREQLVTSYHMKTTMFWIIENTPAMMWRKSNIYRCVRICLSYLKHFIKTGYLPNYFIPKANLFYKHSFHSAIQNTKQIIFILNSYITTPMLLVSHLSANPIMNCILVKLRYFTHGTFCTIPSIELLQSVIHNCCLYSDCEFTMVLKMLVDSIENNSNLDETHAKQNKSVYIKCKKIRNISLMKTHFDTAAGWLHVGTYYYEIEQYNEAKQLCTHALHSISTGVIYCGSIIGSAKTLAMLIQKLEKGDLDFQKAAKHMTAAYVHINNKRMYPSELKIEVMNIISIVINIPPLPYAYFVLFLCAHHSNNVPAQHDSLKQLEELVQHKHYGIHPMRMDTSIIFNMIGVCYELLCNKPRAELYYEICANFKLLNNIDSPFKEAALIRLQLLAMQDF